MSAGALAVGDEKTFGQRVDDGVNYCLNGVECANPFEYWPRHSEEHRSYKAPTVRRILVTAAIVGLVVTNPYVQNAVNSSISFVADVLGLGNDEDDFDDEEPIRLTIGRSA